MGRLEKVIRIGLATTAAVFAAESVARPNLKPSYLLDTAGQSLRLGVRATAESLGLQIVTEILPSTPAEKLHQIAEELGDRPPTFEEAQSYLPIMAQMHIDSTGSKLKVNDIVGHIFLIRRDFPAVEAARQEVFAAIHGTDSVLGNPTIVQLQKDYPNLEMTEDKAREILRGMGNGDNLAWESESALSGPEIFILYDRSALNYASPDSFATYVGKEYSKSRFQYTEFGAQVDCTPITPFNHLLEIVLHETDHLEASAWKEASPAVQEAWGKLTSPLSPDTVLVVEGFQLQENNPDDIAGTITLKKFDELATDYIAATTALQNGFPARLSFKPVDYLNLEKLLAQADISRADFIRMHRSAGLEELATRIADHTLDDRFTTLSEKLMYALPPIVWFEDHPDAWRRFNSQFWFDTVYYTYQLSPYPRISQYNMPGCKN